MSKNEKTFSGKEVLLMSIAGIEQVRNAESEAEQIRKKADADADELLLAARREAAEVIEKAERTAEESYRVALEKAGKDADSVYQGKIDKETAFCEQIKAQGRNRKGPVIDEIVRKVVNLHGNS